MRPKSSLLINISMLLLGLQLTTTCADTNVELNGKFIPPDNKVLMFIGQDSDTIQDYIATMPEDNIEAVTLYTSLKHHIPEKALPAISSPANWNAGEVSYSKTLAKAPGAALAIGLAFDACNQDHFAKIIAEGIYDNSILKLADYLKSIAPRKVFLRIGYEFDGPWNCYQPESYKAAFRHISMMLNKHEVANVVTVWQSAAWPAPNDGGENMALYDHRNDGMLENWYPGDDVVDWISISSFYRDLSQWNFTPINRPEVVQDQILEFARARNKPVMIAEAAPQGYRIAEQTRSYIHMNKPEPFPAEQIWDAWFAPFFDFIHKNNDVIRAVAYINTHWDSQPMWQCTEGIQAGSNGCNNGNWGDSRVQANALIKQRWLNEINNSARWIQRSDY